MLLFEANWLSIVCLICPAFQALLFLNISMLALLGSEQAHAADPNLREPMLLALCLLLRTFRGPSMM